MSQAGVPVHLSLGWPASGVRRDGQVPTLDIAAGSATQETDVRGRAFFGDILIMEGSGRVAEDATSAPNTPSAASMELELSFSMDAESAARSAGYCWCSICILCDSGCSQQQVQSETVALFYRDAGEGWTCVVLFADNALRFSALRSLNEKQHLLAARHAEVNAKLEAVRQAAGSAAAAYKDACKAVEAGQKEVEQSSRAQMTFALSPVLLKRGSASREVLRAADEVTAMM